jgi:metal-dependent amidase/aminoacylase/carboxypeptidase family protein
VESLKIEYFGRNAHAAGIPWEGINALDAMVLAYNNIGLLRQQILPTDR